LSKLSLDWLAAGSVRNLVFTSGTASFAIEKAVGAEAHVELRLAEHAKLLAPALVFWLLALGTNDA
jgi:hypothetical protein